MELRLWLDFCLFSNCFKLFLELMEKSSKLEEDHTTGLQQTHNHNWRMQNLRYHKNGLWGWSSATSHRLSYYGVIPSGYWREVQNGI